MATPTDAQAQAKPAFDKSKLKQAVAAFKAAKKLFDAKDDAGSLESYRSIVPMMALFGSFES